MHRDDRARPVPSTIFSMPRLKGSMLPVRLMAPSAKMQTTWPAASSRRAARMDSTASRGPLVPTGMALVRRRNQWKRLHLVDRASTP